MGYRLAARQLSTDCTARQPTMGTRKLRRAGGAARCPCAPSNTNPWRGTGHQAVQVRHDFQARLRAGTLLSFRQTQPCHSTRFNRSPSKHRPLPAAPATIASAAPPARKVGRRGRARLREVEAGHQAGPVHQAELHGRARLPLVRPLPRRSHRDVAGRKAALLRRGRRCGRCWRGLCRGCLCE